MIVLDLHALRPRKLVASADFIFLCSSVEILGKTKILKKTNTLIFLFCELICNDKIIASASGIWKILRIKSSDLGPGG